MYREKLAKIVDRHIDTINKSGAGASSSTIQRERRQSEDEANRFAVERLGKISRGDARSIARWWCGYYGRNDIEYMTDVLKRQGS